MLRDSSVSVQWSIRFSEVRKVNYLGIELKIILYMNRFRTTHYCIRDNRVEELNYEEFTENKLSLESERGF